MSRGPYAKVAPRNTALLECICEFQAEHPFWGYILPPDLGVIKGDNLLVRIVLESRKLSTG